MEELERRQRELEKARRALADVEDNPEVQQLKKERNEQLSPVAEGAIGAAKGLISGAFPGAINPVISPVEQAPHPDAGGRAARFLSAAGRGISSVMLGSYGVAPGVAAASALNESAEIAREKALRENPQGDWSEIAQDPKKVARVAFAGAATAGAGMLAKKFGQQAADEIARGYLDAVTQRARTPAFKAMLSAYAKQFGKDGVGNVISGHFDDEAPWEEALIAYRNVLYPFKIPELNRTPWGAAITGGYLDINLVGFTVQRITRYRDYVNGSYQQSYTTEDLTALGVTVGLIGITYDENGKPEYEVLAHQDASLSTAESGTTISVDAAAWLTAYVANCQKKDCFAVFIGASDYNAQPGLPMDGVKFMRTIAEKTFKFNLTYQSQYGELNIWTGSTQTTEIHFDNMIWTGGIAVYNPEAMSAETDEV